MGETLRVAVARLKDAIVDIRGDLDKFVTVDRFSPIEKIVWAITMAILLGAVGAILKLIYR